MNAMSCEQVEALLEPVLDGELPAEELMAVRAHLATCARCQNQERAMTMMTNAVRQAMPRYAAPEALRKRVQAALRRSGTVPSRREAYRHGADAARDTGRWTDGHRYLRTPLVQRVAYAMYAMALVVVAIGGWSVGRSGEQRHLSELTRSRFPDEVVASQVRSLMANHLTDVRSTDRHTVKPWFAGLLDFAPRVEDFTAQGFTLLGGRLDYMQGRPVAALVYGRRRHIINVLEWPVRGDDPGPIATVSKGYSLLHWVDGDLSYWAVSDAAPEDLEALHRLYSETR